MDPVNDDRRRRRTRRQLRGALLDLLREKPYEAITVQDIADRADVARSTFYMHYLDKTDLLVGQAGVFADDPGQGAPHMRRGGGPGGPLPPARVWFEHLQRHRWALRGLTDETASDLARKALGDMLRRTFQAHVGQLPADPRRPIPAPVLVEYLVSTFMVLVAWWLEQSEPYTPEQMDALFQRMAGPALDILNN